MKRAALYVRVSTLEQHTDMQFYDLRRFAEQRGFEIVHEYTDRTSGARSTRPGLDAMLSAARKREFDVLLVWASDRLARWRQSERRSYYHLATTSRWVAYTTRHKSRCRGAGQRYQVTMLKSKIYNRREFLSDLIIGFCSWRADHGQPGSISDERAQLSNSRLSWHDR
jgi:hypothetical protein